MSDLTSELTIIFLLILANGFFSMSEMAIVSRKARLQQKADDGDEGSKIALELANEPTAFLSTVRDRNHTYWNSNRCLRRCRHPESCPTG